MQYAMASPNTPPKEPTVVNIAIRTNDNRFRTPAEVKRMLHEIAFVLKLSRGIKMEIVAGTRQAPSCAVEADGIAATGCAV